VCVQISSSILYKSQLDRNGAGDVPSHQSEREPARSTIQLRFIAVLWLKNMRSGFFAGIAVSVTSLPAKGGSTASFPVTVPNLPGARSCFDAPSDGRHSLSVNVGASNSITSSDVNPRSLGASLTASAFVRFEGLCDY
jgi:hypothetical protein